MTEFIWNGSFPSSPSTGDTLVMNDITYTRTSLGTWEVTGGVAITETGALNSGSITSGFGTINNGASSITTTGALGAGATTVTTFTSTGIDDNATSTALTLDSSQNASFAGDVTIDGETLLVNSPSTATDVAEIHFNGSTTTSARYAHISKMYDSPYTMKMQASNSAGQAPLELWGSSDTMYLGFDTSGNATFGGTITGNGSELTALNGSNISTGTIAAARVATLNQDTTGTAAKVTVSDHSANNIAYPVVWHNNNNVLYDTVSKFTFTPSSGTLTATAFVGNLTGNVTGSSGSCTGNAATVTNGVYTTGTQTISGAKTFTANITQTKSAAAITQTSTSYVSNFMTAATANWAYTRMKSGSTFYDLAVNTGDASGAFQIRPSGSGTNAFLISTAGDATVNGSITTTSSVNANTIVLGSGVNLKESTHRADLLTIESQTSTWAGIQIDNTQSETLWNFMADGTTAGIYDDTSNAWMTQWIDGSETRLYFAGSEKFNTLTGGAHVTGALTASGNITAYSSDERLKDAVPLTDCMSAVNQWEVIRYKWNEKAKKLNEVFEKADDYEVGLSAQSVEKTHPELVSLAPFDRSREDGSSVSGENYITMDYSRAVSVVVGALQEKDKEIQELKEQVAELIKLVNK